MKGLALSIFALFCISGYCIADSVIETKKRDSMESMVETSDSFVTHVTQVEMPGENILENMITSFGPPTSQENKDGKIIYAWHLGEIYLAKAGATASPAEREQLKNKTGKCNVFVEKNNKNGKNNINKVYTVENNDDCSELFITVPNLIKIDK